jgi:M6 family metalloprotease-like protein
MSRGRSIKSGTRVGVQAVRVLLAAVLFAGTVVATDPVLMEFGYGHMRREEVHAIGHHPLLLILATVSNQPALRHNAQYYYDRVFSTNAGVTSLNNYLLENSGGRFQWGSASGAPVQVSLATNESLNALQAYMIEHGLDDTPAGVHWFEHAWFSKVISKASTQGGFNFDAFNTNPHDGNMSWGELGVLVIANDPGSPGLGRWPNSEIEGTALRFTGMAAAAMEQNGYEMGFNVFCHEATHLLGALDLYGHDECLLSMNLSLYGDKINGDPDGLYPNITGSTHEIYHLDPWHKLQLGWIEPRICSLGASGSATLYPPQSGLTNACTILYDPSHGTLEFLIAEYRAYNTSHGAGYDANVAGNGVVLWHVRHAFDLAPAKVTCGCGTCTNGQYTDNVAVYTEGAPNLKFGGCTPWIGNRTITSPTITDPSASEPKLFHARLHVQPFNSGADSLTLSWTHVDWRWVDFNFAGLEFGTYAAPHDTLQEAVNAASAGGSIRVKSGTNNETLTIGTGNKALTIEAHGGNVTIGR